ncbi:RidA family protein [Argonema antarcticum]|uniref:RidA family protein n=1 Tax=Argonema antarcticum TaxID=2942763 RepID=UPI0020122DA8|nr:RidA family protein [Argonema antarcticum]MCL1470214.1 RidA family protein [Argonema antarcticum A004/B2]
MNNITRVKPILLILGIVAILVTFAWRVDAADIIRYRLDPSSPYVNQFLESVAVPGNKDLLFLSGMVPPAIDPNADPNTPKAYGDTKTQTRNILKNIESILKKRGYSMSDVIKVHGYLVGDPALNGKADFGAFQEAYAEFFGNSKQPEIPVRTRTQVTQLVGPGWLVEIEVVAAK